DVVARTLTFFDEERYKLFAWCVMPNHVHAVVHPIGTSTLASILHSWKSYSAKEINALLGRAGRLWQREYFDRIIRDDEDLEQTIQYVLANPVKSGLVDWPFVSAGWKPAERPAGRRRSVRS
ncbi:MAG TPA: transposase, partial [Thermoanaerobaculia bacterium]|nr:transposase [Thermoanaerobaculia bacterium]